MGGSWREEAARDVSLCGARRRDPPGPRRDPSGAVGEPRGAGDAWGWAMRRREGGGRVEGSLDGPGGREGVDGWAEKACLAEP